MDVIDAQSFNASPDDIVLIVPGVPLNCRQEIRFREELKAFKIRAVLLPAGSKVTIQPPAPKYFEAQTMDGKTIKVLVDD